MMDELVEFTIKIDIEIYDLAKKHANHLNVSLNDYFIMAIEKYIENLSGRKTNKSPGRDD